MPASTGKKDAARSLYAQGLSQVAIAKKLGIGVATVTDYKKQAKGTDQDWDKHRADLKGKAPAPRPNLVTFERPRGGQPPRQRPQEKAAEEVDLLESVNDAIADVVRLLGTADNLQGLGGAASGLVALGRFKLELESNEAQLEELMRRYRHPHKLIEALREQGWGREQA